MALGSYSATRRPCRPPSCDLNAVFLVPKWTPAVLSLIFSGRIWYQDVESGVLQMELRVGCLPLADRVCLITTPNPFYFELSLPRTCVLLDWVLPVLRPTASFSHLKSRKQAVCEVASACHMFTNSNRLIGLDRMAVNRQNQFQITQSSSSVASWVRLISKKNPLAGWC